MWQEESILIESNCGSRKSSASLSDKKASGRKKSKQGKNFYRDDSMEEDSVEDLCKFRCDDYEIPSTSKDVSIKHSTSQQIL